MNREQVLVAVGQDGALRGAVWLWDGGHDIVFVGEFALQGPSPRATAIHLLRGVLTWLQEREKQAVVFHSNSPEFMALLIRYGAEVFQTGMSLLHADVSTILERTHAVQHR